MESNGKLWKSTHAWWQVATFYWVGLGEEKFAPSPKICPRIFGFGDFWPLSADAASTCSSCSSLSLSCSDWPFNVCPKILSHSLTSLTHNYCGNSLSLSPSLSLSHTHTHSLSLRPPFAPLSIHAHKYKQFLSLSPPAASKVPFPWLRTTQRREKDLTFSQPRNFCSSRSGSISICQDFATESHVRFRFEGGERVVAAGEGDRQRTLPPKRTLLRSRQREYKF